jgi:hypothetical protein
VDSEATELWAAVNAVYDGFLVGNQEAIDRNISPDATIWDSAHAPLVRGKGELDAVRDARASDGTSRSSCA